MDPLVISDVFYIKKGESKEINLVISNILPETLTSILSGKVIFCGNKNVINATVCLRSIKNCNLFFSSITNNYGEYAFLNIPKSMYIIYVKIFDTVVYKKKVCLNTKLTNYCNIYL